MAITMNAKGTTSPHFKIGKQGTNIFQGSSDPSGSYTTAEGDIWIDTSNKSIKFRNSSNNGWTQGSVDITGNATISGDLTINGTTTTLDTTNLLVEDPLLILARSVSGTPSVDAGIVVERGDSTNVGIIWDESTDQWAAVSTTETGSTAGNVSISGYADLKADTIIAADVGIGTDSPEALLNVVTGSAGTWTAPSNFNDVVIESNTNAGLVVAVPDADEGVIGISSPSNNGAIGYGMLYDYDVGIGRLFTSKVGASTRIEADNQVANLTLAGAAGSETATFAGSVGIGTAPSVELDIVKSGADADVQIKGTGGSYGAYLHLNSGASSPYAHVKGSYNGTENWRIGAWGHANQLAFGVGSSPTEVMRLTTTANYSFVNMTIQGNSLTVGDNNAGSNGYDSLIHLLGDSSSGFRIGVDSGNTKFQLDREYNGWQTDQLTMARATGRVGIGTGSPAATLDVTGTDAMIVPKGTTAERPGSAESGMVRFNTTTSCFEGYNGTSWVNLGAYN